MGKKESTVQLRYIDPAIREVVAKLNLQGFRTVSSCAGHPEKKEEEPIGGIAFIRKYPHGWIRRILEDFGLNIISIREFSNPWYPTPRTLVKFQPLGGPSAELGGEPSIEKLPEKSEAVGYFKREGVSEKEAGYLASLMGYKEG